MSRSSDDEAPPTTIGYAPSLPPDSPVGASPPETTAAPRPASIMPAKKTRLHVGESDTGVRAIAASIGEALAEILRDRATVRPADVSRRRREEMSQWRREQGARERSDHTQYEDPDGE